MSPQTTEAAYVRRAATKAMLAEFGRRDARLTRNLVARVARILADDSELRERFDAVVSKVASDLVILRNDKQD